MMEPSKAAMKAALRVLTALSERQQPDQSDVDELHWYAPSERERPIDELVCEAIQRALKEREQRRKAIQAQMREKALARTPDRDYPRAASQAGDPEVERLILEHSERKQEYRALNAKLKSLGIAFQQASAKLIAADAGALSPNSQAAKDILESIAADVDISGITQLLNEHVRLTKLLISDAQTLKKHGIK